MNIAEAPKVATKRPKPLVRALPPEPMDRPIELAPSDTSAQAIAAAQSTVPAAKQFKIYVAYGWSSDNGKKHGFGAVILNSTFPEVETEQQLHAAFAEVVKESGKPNVTPLYFLSLEG